MNNAVLHLRVPELVTKPYLVTLRASLSSFHLPGLDGLRILAALLVMLYHFHLARKIGDFGNLGVEIFFVLSGFLITWLLLREQEEQGTINLRQFYIRRSLRIFPAFYVYWLLCFGLVLLGGAPILWGHLLSAFCYVSNLYQGPSYYILGHSWSLGVEEQFYLLWPLGFLLCRGNLKRMTYFLTAVIVLVWGYRACLVLILKTEDLYTSPIMRWDQLMVGCLLSVLLKRQVLIEYWSLLCFNPWLPIITLFLLVVSAHLSVVGIPTPFHHITSYTYMYAVGFTVDPVLSALLIVQLIGLHTQRLWQWLSGRSVQYLAQISYSLYLYHVLLAPAPVSTLLDRYLRWWPLVFVAQLSATFLLASISYWWVEQPFLSLRKRFA